MNEPQPRRTAFIVGSTTSSRRETRVFIPLPLFGVEEWCRKCGILFVTSPSHFMRLIKEAKSDKKGILFIPAKRADWQLASESSLEVW